MIKFPFLNGQQLNLDWIMQQLRAILNFMPIDQGAVGDVLQRGTQGATWQPLTSVVYDIDGMTPAAELTTSDELPIYDVSAQGNYKVTVQDVLDLAAAAPVSSVNGQTGAVVLGKSDVGLGNVDNVQQYSASNPPPYPVISVNGQTGAVVVSGGAVDSVNGQTGTVVLGKSDVGLGNVDNVQQYSASNPPPYPVTSVNGQTGDVVVTPGGSFSPTLLWTNSAPNGSFAAQTIPLDLSGYSFVIIEYGVDGVGTLLTSFLPVPTLPPPAGYSSYNELQGIYVTSSNGRMAKRYLQISTAGLVFGGGTRFDNYNNSNSGDNNVCIPTRIWGI